jgi:hypothetical protein
MVLGRPIRKQLDELGSSRRRAGLSRVGNPRQMRSLDGHDQCVAVPLLGCRADRGRVVRQTLVVDE